MQNKSISATEAFNRLVEGNARYLCSKTCPGDVSPAIRTETSKNGQKPYAVVVSCADSRVIPEAVFSAGIGELFVVRVAGNVIDNNQLGSIQYAVEHLGSNLVVVLGHTQCGAVGAALHENDGYIKCITDEIKCAIGNETDGTKASVLNVQHSVEKIKNLLSLPDGVAVCGALYHTDSGRVEFLGGF